MGKERQVKSSTSKKLSVSSERMEQSFKKVQHYAIPKRSLSLPIKEARRNCSYALCLLVSLTIKPKCSQSLGNSFFFLLSLKKTISANVMTGVIEENGKKSNSFHHRCLKVAHVCTFGNPCSLLPPFVPINHPRGTSHQIFFEMYQ